MLHSQHMSYLKVEVEDLTHQGMMTHMFTKEQSHTHNCFRYWLGRCSTSCHYLDYLFFFKLLPFITRTLNFSKLGLERFGSNPIHSFSYLILQNNIFSIHCEFCLRSVP